MHQSTWQHMIEYQVLIRHQIRLVTYIVAIVTSLYQQQDVIPCRDYRDKYKHLIGSSSGQEAAKITQPNKSFGYGGLPWILLFMALMFDPSSA